MFGEEIVEGFRDDAVQRASVLDGQNLQLVAHLFGKVHGDRACHGFFLRLRRSFYLGAVAGASAMTGLWRTLPPVSASSSVRLDEPNGDGFSGGRAARFTAMVHILLLIE